ncbi:hypothetical protein J3R82DRAFT_2057 [Butyriboletus roseoflavus]|nr:hypothetical protein J3R82DRAFT_2057 [Butyriboletus roseoflavus]
MSFAGTTSQLAGLQTSKVGLLLRCLSTHLTLLSLLTPVNGVDSISTVRLSFARDPHYFFFGIVLTCGSPPVAGMAILIFDYAITLEDEARWVWGHAWDVTRFVFTVSRYIPFAGAGMTAYVALRSNSDSCGPSSGQSSLIIHVLGIIAAEVLLVLRTYAFWQGDKRVLYGLFAYAGVTIGAAVGIAVVPQQLIPGAQAPPGCYLTAGRNGTFVYLFLMFFEMVILFLMVYKYIRSYREVRSSIVTTIYRDGMFYIACIILVTFTNTVVDGALPFQFSDLLETAQITLHSVLASRILFNLRKSTCCQQTVTTMDPIMFNDDAFDQFSSAQSPNEFELSGKGV